MAANGYEVIPSAKRLIRSLRDMGYEFAAAVADLVDNSIEARANTVRIHATWAGESTHVLIADNGDGMTAEQLREALRFGSERDYLDEDLGKFGLGLKTASLSQCLRVTVASRHNVNRADINAYCWDVAHIEATNRWEILPVRTADLPEKARQHLKETTGTVVVWERLDRILGYKRPDGEVARKQFMAMCRELEEHAAMVFHRFLSGEVRGKRLAIYLNDNKVMPWDPFARSEEATKKLQALTFPVDGVAGKGNIIVEPFVLPHQSKFSSIDAFNRASGPKKWNPQQGFYIYRADRLVQSGGWSGLRAIDEHRKLSRIAISFNPKLDEEFKINVPKMRVALPASVRDDVAKAIGPAVKLAEEAYRKSERKSEGSSSAAPAPAPQPARKPTSSDSTSVRTQDGGGSTTNAHNGNSYTAAGTAGSGFTAEEVRKVAILLRKVARPDERDVVNTVVDRAVLSLEG